MRWHSLAYFFLVLFLFPSARLPSDFVSNNFSSALQNAIGSERDKGRDRERKRSREGHRGKVELHQFGKCGYFPFRAYTREMDRRFGLRQNVTLFKLWKVIYYSHHNKREFPSVFFCLLHLLSRFSFAFYFRCFSNALFALPYPFFTIFSMYLLYDFFLVCRIAAEARIACFLCVYVANVSNIFPILMWSDASHVLILTYFFHFVFIFSFCFCFFSFACCCCRHLFIFWCHCILLFFFLFLSPFFTQFNFTESI